VALAVGVEIPTLVGLERRMAGVRATRRWRGEAL
jgi:hypothetical protein